MKAKTQQFSATNIAVVILLLILAVVVWPRSRPLPIPAPEGANSPPTLQRVGQSNPPALPQITSIPQRLVVVQPTLVIYAPAQVEIDASKGEEFAAIDDFLRYSTYVRQQLQQKRPDISLINTDAGIIQTGEAVFIRKSTRDFGFLFFAPPQKPKIIEGVLHGDELLMAAEAYFPTPTPAESK